MNIERRLSYETDRLRTEHEQNVRCIYEDCKTTEKTKKKGLEIDNRYERWEAITTGIVLIVLFIVFVRKNFFLACAVAGVAYIPIVNIDGAIFEKIAKKKKEAAGLSDYSDVPVEIKLKSEDDIYNQRWHSIESFVREEHKRKMDEYLSDVHWPTITEWLFNSFKKIVRNAQQPADITMIKVEIKLYVFYGFIRFGGDSYNLSSLGKLYNLDQVSDKPSIWALEDALAESLLNKCQQFFEKSVTNPTIKCREYGYGSDNYILFEFTERNLASKLYRCKSCRFQVSGDAKACSHCGTVDFLSEEDKAFEYYRLIKLQGKTR